MNELFRIAQLAAANTIMFWWDKTFKTMMWAAKIKTEEKRRNYNKEERDE